MANPTGPNARSQNEDMELAIDVGASLPAARRVASIGLADDRRSSDEELLVRVGDGDSKAFELLYRRYARPVLGLALRRLGDRGRAEDAVQDAFVAIWRSARTYNPKRGSGAPWLYAVARNAITDGLRKTPEPTAELPEQPSSEPTPADQAETSWTAWRVHRALEVLPAHERPVIELA